MSNARIDIVGPESYERRLKVVFYKYRRNRGERHLAVKKDRSIDRSIKSIIILFYSLELWRKIFFDLGIWERKKVFFVINIERCCNFSLSLFLSFARYQKKKERTKMNDRVIRTNHLTLTFQDSISILEHLCTMI